MIKAYIFDLDGTLYRGKTPIPGTAQILEKLRAEGKIVLFYTNAGTKSREGIVEKLTNMGIRARKEEIYCGSYLLAKYMKKNYPNKTVFVVGEIGIFEELEIEGIEPSYDQAEVVAVGLDRHFNYEKLAKSLELINNGATFIASNTDNTFPTEHGDRPGCGAIVAAIEVASKKKPEVVGKPNTYAIDLIKKDHNLKNSEILMVGDRLDTDIQFAKNCKIKSALVLTGTTKKSKKYSIKPDYVFDSVADLPTTLP
ncbi:HAD-IIA family hydrolase [Candidatus Micrarchaeota archaeon]|nr:HAD-IIA family hydrolase [Candidatus Micrarchaeota archaeon]